MCRVINFCLLTVLLSVVSINAYAMEESCYQAKGMACSIVVAAGVALLSVATMVYPPVVTSKLLGKGADGLEKCVPAQIFDSEIRDKMNMAETAFIVNAAVTPVAAISFGLAFFSQTIQESKIGVASLLGLGGVSLLAGLGAELAGVIQSQRSYNQMVRPNGGFCSDPTNDRKHEFRTVLGFSYFDVAVKGLLVFGVPIVAACRSSTLAPNPV